jgi:hypothetical protein
MWRLGEPSEFTQHFYNRHIEETKLRKMKRKREGERKLKRTEKEG